MKILQTVKYYEPSKGGMESVVKNIVDGIRFMSADHAFVVYANNHLPSYKKTIEHLDRLVSIKELTPLVLKSQPLSFRYTSLRKLIVDTDIVHHHYPFPNMELALLRNLDVLKHKKLVITWHANIKNSRWSWIGKYYDPIIKKMMDMAEVVVVTSPQLFEASQLLQNYERKIRVIPLSFDPSIGGFSSTKRQFPENRKFNLLFVGKLRSYKGLPYLIDAVKNLDVVLTIVGDGEQELQLKQQVSDLGMKEKVFFLKDISNEELSSHYKDSDLFILPSINEAEAFGVVQLEAMSNGIPVINTRLESGVPYVSLDGVSGFTVKPQDSQALCEAIKAIMSNKSLYEHFSENSIVRSKLFTRDVMASSYLDLYKSLL
ncbi:MAG: glycosyltransferase [Bacteroidota bacterium]